MGVRHHLMREIAAALGVSRATLYRHMAGSDESASVQIVVERPMRRRGWGCHRSARVRRKP
jgi:AcrR family transcriptional regulator